CGESVFGLNYNNSLSLWNFDEDFLKCRVRTSAPIPEQTFVVARVACDHRQAGDFRQVADSDGEIEFISELLQFHLPQAQPRSIAATAIGRDGEMIGIGIAGRAHQLPPATDRIDCEAGGVVVDADADPAGVLADVVNPVRHGAALAADEEVVDPHFLRLALRTPFAAGVL